MTTGLDIFDKTVQEANLWLKDLMERLETDDRHAAYSMLRAVLHALRDRIGAANAAHLGAQLPTLLRGIYYEGWRMGGPSKERHDFEFAARVAAELPEASMLEAEMGIRAVFSVMAKWIDFGETFKLASVLPAEIRAMWPDYVQEGAKQRGAA